MCIPINIVFEDDLSDYVLTKILNSFGNKYHIGYTYNCHGNGDIKTNIRGYNEAAISTPFLVLTDLDRYPCPPELIADWIPFQTNANFIFRIAVKEVEAWLLADYESFSEFTGVSQKIFTRNPESLSDPKEYLINIARRSRKRELREDIVPIDDQATIGPNYNGRLMEFVNEHWDIERAIQRSRSLEKAYNILENYQYIPPIQ